MEDLDEKFRKAVEPQSLFLRLLRDLTDRGRAEWLQTKHESGFVYCLVDGEELIVFDCRGGTKGHEHVPPSEPLAGVAGEFRNTTYLWLAGLADWDLLLALLKSARIDDERFIECRRIAHWSPVRALQGRLENDT